MPKNIFFPTRSTATFRISPTLVSLFIQAYYLAWDQMNVICIFFFSFTCGCNPSTPQEHQNHNWTSKIIAGRRLCSFEIKVVVI